ncbi:hypothetical protein HDIA_1976 [Hartmannibacter diazotrophicus]|uniref:Prophage minor tail protein Z (GPZ) n=1 Tax=Hartmannibacter diazotrophicus TaxID=1482074 RepID=A0A2C9D5B1_9HYPH|nr:hypothetical protein [Hartmannibacter diazotrophicus]SON55517.1 hypothetical protein HDIA_1976 [Hartmannibacter diazotrophicus]
MLKLAWADRRDVMRFEKGLRTMGSAAMGKVEARAVNHVGLKARTQVRRALTKQTGLKRKTIVKAVKDYRGSAANPKFSLTSRGGDIALRFFGPRETRAGVSATPFGGRKVFRGTFLRGGRFPSRVDLKMGGTVFERAGAHRLPIEKVKSGVFIPTEMVQGETRRAFDTTVARDLPNRLLYDLKRMAPGLF